MRYGENQLIRKINIVLNEFCSRLVTICNNEVEEIYCLLGITLPTVKKYVEADWKKTKIIRDIICIRDRYIGNIYNRDGQL